MTEGTIRWDIIEDTILALKAGQFRPQWGMEPSEFDASYLFEITRAPSGAFAPRFSPRGVLLFMMMAHHLPEQHNEVTIISYGNEGLAMDFVGFSTIIPRNTTDLITGSDDIDLPDLGNDHNKAAEILEDWMLEHRITDVVWTVNRNNVAPWTETVDDNEIPLSMRNRHDKRFALYQETMQSLLSERFPNAIVRVYDGGWDGSDSPCRPWAKDASGDYEWDGFIDLGVYLDSRASAEAWDNYPEPDPYESYGSSGTDYVLAVDDEGFQLYRQGNSDGRPSHSLKEAVSNLFPPIGYGSYPVEYLPMRRNGDLHGDVLCSECMTSTFLENIDDYLDGTESVAIELVDGDGRYESDTICDGCGTIIQPQLCPVCGDNIGEPTMDERDANYRIMFEHDYYRMHGSCLNDELSRTSDQYHKQGELSFDEHGHPVYTIYQWGNTGYKYRFGAIIDRDAERMREADPVVEGSLESVIGLPDDE